MWSDYFKLLIKFEGSTYECDPDDLGGATKYGIDQRSHPGVNIKKLTLEQAEKIHKAEFAASFASQLPEPLCYVVFDFIMNAGTTPAAKAIQKCVGAKVDGKVGPKTKQAIAEYIEQFGQASLIKCFTDGREAYHRMRVKQSPVKQKYLGGWLKRNDTMEKWAIEQLGDAMAF